jgi:hypothetical protein
VNLLSHLVLMAAVPGGVAAFALLPARIAAALVLIAGAMFLPILVLPMPGPLDYGKPEAISFALLAGVLLFDSGRLAAYRPRPLDLVFLAWLVSGPLASISNDLGAYDAFALVLTRLVKWGVPWFVGSLYFGSRDGLRTALWALFLSGLAYVPFCLFEVRMSPRLHAILYGMSQHGFEQTMRGGGWRPMVFMSHGLELSLWMAAATVAGFVLWRARDPLLKRPFGLPMPLLVATVGVTLLLCKSTGAILLGAIGVLAAVPLARRWACWCLLVAVPCYIAVRLFGSGVLERSLVEWSQAISEDRAGSLKFRFDNELLLLQRLWQNPVLGAGGWDFGSIIDPETGEMVPITTDSYWIIAVATNGLFGLFAAVGMLWLPAARGLLARGTMAPERLAASIVLALLVLDSMVNAFVPPFYVALAGALAHVPLREAAADGASSAPASARALAPRTLDEAVLAGRPGADAWLQPRGSRPS